MTLAVAEALNPNKTKPNHDKHWSKRLSSERTHEVTPWPVLEGKTKTGEWETAHLVLVEGNSGELFELGLGV